MNGDIPNIIKTTPGIILSMLLLLLSSSRVSAQLYGWSIDEIYSSADGSVQFIELSTKPAPGGLLASGYNFVSSNPFGTISQSYSTGVGQFSGGGYQFLLFATPDFSLLPGAIQPDYTIPSGFLFLHAGRLTVSTLSPIVGPSSISYFNLPNDGTHALDANGNVVPALAENFAGQTYVVPEPSTASMLFLGLLAVSFRLRNSFRDPSPLVVGRTSGDFEPDTVKRL